ncbi:MAG: hypothetical protein LKE40_02555 [Spirochaetia bacterium]|nr:hypothetical protein [Spirochaetia bacterium]
MYSDLYKKAQELYGQGIFGLYDMGSVMAVRIPHDGDIHYCVIEDSSIFIYEGARGFESWVDLLDQDDETGDLAALEKEYMRYGYSIDFIPNDEATAKQMEEAADTGILPADIFPTFNKHLELCMPLQLSFTEKTARLIATVLDAFAYAVQNKLCIDCDEDQLKCLTPSGGSFSVSSIQIPEEFNRFPSPRLQGKSQNLFLHAKKLKSTDWDLHMFIIPDANIYAEKLGIRKFPIAYVLIEEGDATVLCSGFVIDFSNDYHKILDDVLHQIEQRGLPSSLNVTSDRAYCLFSELCDQLDIELSQYSTLDDAFELEDQFLDDFNKGSYRFPDQLS